VQGESDRANALLDYALAMPRQRDPVGGLWLYRVSPAVRAALDVGEAANLLRESFDEMTRSGVLGAVYEWLGSAASVFAQSGDPERAARLLAFVRAETIGRGGAVRSPTMYLLYRHDVRRVRATLPPDVSERCRAEGAKMTDDEAVATAFEGLALIASEPLT
jgi:hypothetical protein